MASSGIGTVSWRASGIARTLFLARTTWSASVVRPAGPNWRPWGGPSWTMRSAEGSSTITMCRSASTETPRLAVFSTISKAETSILSTGTLPGWVTSSCSWRSSITTRGEPTDRLRLHRGSRHGSTPRSVVPTAGSRGAASPMEQFSWTQSMRSARRTLPPCGTRTHLVIAAAAARWRCTSSRPRLALGSATQQIRSGKPPGPSSMPEVTSGV